MATFQNYATLTYNGLTAVSNLVTGEITSGLRMTKTAIAETYVMGGSVTYALNLINSDASEHDGLILNDDLGAYAFRDEMLTPLRYVHGSARCFVNGELQESLTVTDGPPLRIEGFRVPAGGNVIILYQTEVTAYAPLCGSGKVQNTATLTGSGITEALTAVSVLSPECGVDLGISKSIEPATVTDNGELTYTFLITNCGSRETEETDSVSVRDHFDPVLREITVALNGQHLSEEQYQYDTADGLFTINPGVVQVPAASFAQDPELGIWSVKPGTAVLTVSGKL